VIEFLSITPDSHRKRKTGEDDHNVTRKLAASEIVLHFRSPDFLLKLAYLCDIFGTLNQLNSSMQGPKMTVYDAHSKIQGMKNQLKFFANKLSVGDLVPFPILKSCLAEKSIGNLPEKITTCIKDHLVGLGQEFDKYFPENDVDNEWVLNPFSYNVENLPEELSTEGQGELLSLTADINLKQRFKILEPEEFWLSYGKRYPLLYQEATKMFIRFATSYLCEKGFSTMLYLKNKHRSRLDVEHDMRIKLSNVKDQIIDDVIDINHNILN
jgi:zinc finger BED domain-containing protein 5/7/8/9